MPADAIPAACTLRITGRIVDTVFLGSHVDYRVAVGSEIVAVQVSNSTFAPGPRKRDRRRRRLGAGRPYGADRRMKTIRTSTLLMLLPSLAVFDFVFVIPLVTSSS